MENKEAAIRAFNQALEIQPNYERAWMNLGVIFMEIEPPMLREASIFLRRAIEIQPGLKKAREKLEECEQIMNV
jgi:Flp pilus assembly protein TadD